MNKENNNKPKNAVKTASDFRSTYSNYKDKSKIVNKFSTWSFADFYDGKT